MTTAWKYYIPHVWEHDRASWEDVYLLPDIPLPASERAPSIWLTIDSLAFYDQAAETAAGDPTRTDALRLLGDRDHYISGTDMTVRDEWLTKERVLYWARIFLQENGFSVGTLREATHEEFRDTNEHAIIVEQLKKRDSTF